MDERRVSCRITDLSLGGARVVCESCENAGEIVYLVIPTMGQGTPIRSRVVASELDQASLRFELDEHSEAALIMHLMADPATHDML